MQNDSKENKLRKTLYLDEDLCQKIQVEADKEERSFNAFIVRLLERAINSHV